MTQVEAGSSITHFDAVFSFADADRTLAVEIACVLELEGISVFYDGVLHPSRWAEEIHKPLSEIFERRANYYLMLVSEQYVTNEWTAHRRADVHARALALGAEYVVPIRIDDSELSGLPEGVEPLTPDAPNRANIVARAVDKILGENEARLKAQGTKVFNELEGRSRAGTRVACCRCESLWRGPDNFHFCIHCQLIYCYKCVGKLTKVSESEPCAKEYMWRCTCGGRVW
jgi:hypothetical protein